jgi:hypothetical protein
MISFSTFGALVNLAEKAKTYAFRGAGVFNHSGNGAYSPPSSVSSSPDAQRLCLLHVTFFALGAASLALRCGWATMKAAMVKSRSVISGSRTIQKRLYSGLLDQSPAAGNVDVWISPGILSLSQTVQLVTNHVEERLRALLEAGAGFFVDEYSQDVDFDLRIL